MEIKTVTANGIDFGYLEMGEGPLALCLHGFPDTAHTWRHLMPELAARGYRAVAPFMRGYAPTSIPGDGVYEPGALVADACALHEVLGGDGDAVLIGHDWGAFPVYGATAFAPDRWRRGVAMAVPPPAAMLTRFFEYDQLKRSFYVFLFQTPLAETAAAGEGFIEGLWRDWSPGYDAAEDVAHVRRSLGEPANLAAAIGYYRAMLGTVPPSGRYAAEQAATGGDVPILYLHGKRDGCLDPGLAVTAPHFLPKGSKVKVIDEMGHFLHLERPEEVNRLVLHWLEQ
ncbi:alpha/beta fold hydrolase [Planobispora takensis]|uniref:Alpha/beta hydrolase n=1 Tax=Planobispora takensis TaxID=1367882 RepID=A0A8J3SX99_9ACTN|nr:alpha/beta hydrolase [Planobispora takensis]GII00453.1 alpha/beta hydrolase [Planobispora takensis]